ncbi:MAG TPA: PLP-dependent aminotransferase family protein [Candidatus Acidoferrales bacterium]|nr:PLP-dependent aminotransferase family protein [Candidatus Acidoferrales bacterium]
MEEPLPLEPLFPDRSSGQPLAEQLTRRLRDAIENGALPAGTKVLGSRQLAKRLGLGRNTVALAFEQLSAEGYLESKRGSGTVVAEARFERPRRAPISTAGRPPQADRIASLRAHFDDATGRGALRPGMPALSMFPWKSWNRCVRHAAELEGNLGYGPASGLRVLREAIAQHVRQFRGIAADPEQIVVVEGAQAAMHLAAIVLARSGDTIAIEDPCYALARAAFGAAALRLHPVRVDRDGIRSGELPKQARFAFLTPTHQFPLGGTLPLVRRLEVLAWAEQRDAYVLEDDYDSEFTSRVRPLPALQSLDRNERVVYIGSFSKTLAPGLRIGYAIAPPHLASAFRTGRASTSLGTSIALQAALAQFVKTGAFARHLRRMNAAYEERRSALVHALQPLARRGFEIGPMQVGLHVALTSKQPFADRAVASSLEGQRLVALSSLCLKRSDCFGFVLGFTNGTSEEIARAAGALAGEVAGAPPGK